MVLESDKGEMANESVLLPYGQLNSVSKDPEAVVCVV
jgi:hypothetical protein